MSTLVNRQVLQPYVFRNYCIPPLVEHNYVGSSQHELWEALQATSAAPGYFEECKIGTDIHQVTSFSYLFMFPFVCLFCCSVFYVCLRLFFFLIFQRV